MELVTTPTRGQLIATRVQLERRLHAGWDAIGLAEEEGRERDAHRFFTVWEGVLRDYERTCDALRAREGR